MLFLLMIVSCSKAGDESPPAEAADATEQVEQVAAKVDDLAKSVDALRQTVEAAHPELTAPAEDAEEADQAKDADTDEPAKAE